MAERYITIANRTANPKVEGEYMGRSRPNLSPLGNPFYMSCEADREDVIQQFEEWLPDQLMIEDSPQAREMERLVELAKSGPITLVCHCYPKACHVDIIARTIHKIISETHLFVNDEYVPFGYGYDYE